MARTLLPRCSPAASSPTRPPRPRHRRRAAPRRRLVVVAGRQGTRRARPTAVAAACTPGTVSAAGYHDRECVGRSAGGAATSRRPRLEVSRNCLAVPDEPLALAQGRMSRICGRGTRESVHGAAASASAVSEVAWACASTYDWEVERCLVGRQCLVRLRWLTKRFREGGALSRCRRPAGAPRRSTA
jgi:hypothetical protein